MSELARVVARDAAPLYSAAAAASRFGAPYVSGI